MKKTIWPSVHKFLKSGLFTCALLLCLFRFFTSITVIHAATLLCNPLPSCLLNPTATPTSTPAPAPTPTSTSTPTTITTPASTTDLTPTPTAIPTPLPQATHTPQLQRINTISPTEPVMTDMPTPATFTMTPVAATATLVPTTPSNATPMTTDTSHIKQQLQDTGDTGINTMMLSLGTSAVVLLVSVGLIFLIWKRKSKQNGPILQGTFGNTLSSPMQPAFSNSQVPPMQSAFSNSQVSSLVNNYEIPPTANTPQYAPSGAPAPGMSGTLPALGSVEAMPSPQPAYIPSNLRPMTAALPQHMLTMTSNNGISSAQNGDLLPLPMDMNLPFQTNGAGTPNTNGQSRLSLAQPMGSMDTPIPSPPSLLPAWMESSIPSTPSPLPTWMEDPLPSPQSLSPAIPLAIQPPSLREDPVLEEAMRQAQIGLFALSGR